MTEEMKTNAPRKRGRKPKYGEGNLPGRPPRNPAKKLREMLRFLATTRMRGVIGEAAKKKNLSESDIMRLAMYQYLDNNGFLTEELRADTTWDTLIEMAVVPAPDIAKIRAERAAAEAKAAHAPKIE